MENRGDVVGGRLEEMDIGREGRDEQRNGD